MDAHSSLMGQQRETAFRASGFTRVRFRTSKYANLQCNKNEANKSTTTYHTCKYSHTCIHAGCHNITQMTKGRILVTVSCQLHNSRVAHVTTAAQSQRVQLRAGSSQRLHAFGGHVPIVIDVDLSQLEFQSEKYQVVA